MKIVHAAILTVLVLPSVASQPIAAQENSAKLDEWTVPWEESRPRDPFRGPDGKVWFVGQRSHYAAYLDPETGEFKKYDLEDGTGPHNLIVDDDGMVWYSGNRATHIGRLDPETGEIKQFPLPDEAARDPHTMVFDAQGDIWFTVQFGNFIGKFWKETGEVKLIPAPQAQTRRGLGTSRPYGIKMDSQDRPWVVLFNTNKIAMVEPATMELTIFELPDENSRPRRLVIDSEDKIWYVDHRLGRLGRLDPETGDVKEWDNPSGPDSRPYAVEIDADDRIWFVETGVRPNKFVGFDPSTENFFSIVEVDSGGGSIRHMFYDRDDNVIWFGTDTNTIGRATLPPLKRRLATP